MSACILEMFPGFVSPRVSNMSPGWDGNGKILFMQNMNKEPLQKHLPQKEHLHKNMHFHLFGVFRELGSNYRFFFVGGEGGCCLDLG